jgi:hypothetical protein
MAWSELDLDTGIWTLPAARAKNKRSIGYRCRSRRWQS